MATPKTEKLQTTPETASSMSDQEFNRSLDAMLSEDAEQATPETVEQLLGLNASERDEQEICDMIAAAAEDALLDIKISAAPADVLDPEGASARQRNIETTTAVARNEIASVLTKEYVHFGTASSAQEALTVVKKDPNADNLAKLRTQRDAIAQELANTVTVAKEQESPDDTANREMLEPLLRSIDATLATYESNK